MAIPSIILSPDGSRAVRIDDFVGEEHVFDRDALGLAFRARLAPGAHTSRLIVLLDPLIEANPVDWGFSRLKDLPTGDAVRHIGLAAVGVHLQTLAPGAEQALTTVECWTECLSSLAERKRASDDEILLYIKGKLYWAWKYDITILQFDWFDSLVLGADLETIDRVSLIGHGELLRRQLHPSGAITFEPLRRLLQEFPLTLGQGTASPTSPDILGRLSVPRYAGPKHHLAKAVDFMTANPPDHPNAAKEAISAVEGMARIVAGDPAATLGDLISRLRGQGRLNPALARALDAVWGFASTSPGVRHGATGPVTITLDEADFVLGTSRAALGLLLSLDTP